MRRWAGALRLIGIGWYIAACLVIGLLGGIWLDRILGTAVLFTIVGLFAGLGLAGFGVYRTVLPLIGRGGNSDKENSR